VIGWLLVAVGGLLGCALVLARLATLHGIPPLAFACWAFLGGGTLLLLWARLAGERGGITARTLRYSLISGLFTLALPQSLIYLAVARLGAGLTALAFAFPPLFTYLIVLALRYEPADRIRTLGVALGLAGALVILLPRGGLPDPSLWPWMILVISAPLALAIGNVYRRIAWPAEGRTLTLAAGTQLLAACWIAPVMLASGQFHWPTIAFPGWLILAQMALQAVAFAAYFELNRRAMPVVFSQIGLISLIVAFLAGVFVFEERFTAYVWIALPLVLGGVLAVSLRPGGGGRR
jgi:drug/metabolite transporter (DMT)-like permease